MIELMLEAERAIGIGLLDRAERLYAQVVASDPKNSIAVTGLARVALERGDQRGAYTFARRALALDPENHLARHLSQRMAEQMRNRGEALPDDPLESGSASGSARGGEEPGPASPESVPARPGIVDRLLRRRR